MTSSAEAHLQPDEFTRLIELHRPQLLAFCAGFHDDPHERDELAQLVMIRVWKGLPGFDRRSTFTTWLFQVVRNTALSEYRRRARRPVPVDTVGDASVQVCWSGGAAFEDGVAARDSIVRAMARLDERYRVAVELVDGWGCSPTEASLITGVLEGTVRTRLHRGRRALRVELEGSPA